jgi:hypothetical protein
LQFNNNILGWNHTGPKLLIFIGVFIKKFLQAEKPECVIKTDFSRYFFQLFFIENEIKREIREEALVLQIAERIVIGEMGNLDNELAPRLQYADGFLHKNLGVIQMFKDLLGKDKIGMIVREGEGGAFKVVDDIGVAVGVNINADCAFSFAIFTAKIKDNHSFVFKTSSMQAKLDNRQLTESRHTL